MVRSFLPSVEDTSDGASSRCPGDVLCAPGFAPGLMIALRRMSLYVGLDSSTQSLTATVIEVAPDVRRVVFQHAIVFDRDLPHYGTTNGVLRHPDPLVVT